MWLVRWIKHVFCSFFFVAAILFTNDTSQHNRASSRMSIALSNYNQTFSADTLHSFIIVINRSWFYNYFARLFFLRSCTFDIAIRRPYFAKISYIMSHGKRANTNTHTHAHNSEKDENSTLFSVDPGSYVRWKSVALNLFKRWIVEQECDKVHEKKFKQVRWFIL